VGFDQKVRSIGGLDEGIDKHLNGELSVFCGSFELLHFPIELSFVEGIFFISFVFWLDFLFVDFSGKV